MDRKEREDAHRSAVAFTPFLVTEMGVADRYDVAVREEMLGDALRVDVYAVLAAPVDDSRRFSVGRDDGMTSTDKRRVELNIVVRCPPDGESVLE